jgi:hypothetical protein
MPVLCPLTVSTSRPACGLFAWLAMRCTPLEHAAPPA